MALLQISEPGQASAPHQHKLAIGIDLGTTNSLVASVQSGQSKVLTDENNKAIFAFGGALWQRQQANRGL
ncbi:Chaperone protein HscA [uncultured Gammaproteobacteria bacterium]|nr:Chaperone protein HscA [uncultured Gammaproteobacteria bacterium]